MSFDPEKVERHTVSEGDVDAYEVGPIVEEYVKASDFDTLLEMHKKLQSHVDSLPDTPQYLWSSGRCASEAQRQNFALRGIAGGDEALNTVGSLNYESLPPK